MLHALSNYVDVISLEDNENTATESSMLLKYQIRGIMQDNVSQVLLTHNSALALPQCRSSDYCREISHIYNLKLI